jgi:hypothetical protein
VSRLRLSTFQSRSSWLNKVCMSPPVLVTGDTVNAGSPRTSPGLAPPGASARFVRCIGPRDRLGIPRRIPAGSALCQSDVQATTRSSGACIS